jgi:Type II CAAX prenyl endopeptidase Rce1-like
MKTHFLKIPEQRPAARTHLERGRGVPNASTDTRGDSDQGGMNRMHSLFGRIPAVVWSGALAFVLTVFTGGIWTVLLKGILEQRVSGPVAIVIAALLIAPAHGLTQGFLWPILLWYFFVDVMFGGMAYLTKSILPSAVVHSIGLLIFFILVWPYDAQRRLIWETGANTGFWIAAAQAIIFTVLALLAFIRLARVTKRARATEGS